MLGMSSTAAKMSVIINFKKNGTYFGSVDTELYCHDCHSSFIQLKKMKTATYPIM